MALNNTLQKKSESRLGFNAYVTSEAIKDRINQVVGGKDGQRFITSIISAVQTNPNLQECTNASLLSAALQGEALHLPPSPQLGYFFMVPYNNRKTGYKEAQFQLSAKGYKQLAMRSGQYADIDVLYIREGEYLGRDKYTGKQKFEFIEDDDERESKPIIGYLAYFEMLNGFRKQLYWTKARMERHADTYSTAFSIDAYKKLKSGKIPKEDQWKYSSFWYTSFDEMAEKTMIRQLLSKWGLLSTELVSAIDYDMSVIQEDGSKTYVDNDPAQEFIPVEVNQAEPVEVKAEPVKEAPAKKAAKKELEPEDDIQALFFQ